MRALRALRAVSPWACEPVTASLCLEAKSLEPFALELCVDYSVSVESLKTSLTKNHEEPKDWLKKYVQEIQKTEKIWKYITEKQEV